MLEYILDDAALDAKYSNLTVNPDEYFDNNLHYHNYSQRENLLRLDAPVNRTKWSMTPPTVNAYYAPSKNQIVIPAGLLRAPFFRAAQPPALNFGAIGVVMGHELSHAFDDQGRRYDAGGDMVDWWNNATEAEFQARSGCMRRQYSGYGLSKANVSGQQTLGENIADNGGLSAAYHAYQAWEGGTAAAATRPSPCPVWSTSRTSSSSSSHSRR